MENVNRQFINTYLDAPVISGEMYKCYEGCLAIRGGAKVGRPTKLMNHLAEELSMEWVLEPYDPHILPAILYSLSADVSSTGVSEAWRIAHTIWGYADNGLKALNAALQLPDIPEELPIKARTLLSKAELFVRFVETLSASRASGGRRLIHETIGEITLLGDQYCCAMLYEEDETCFILPYEAVLMIKDLLLARANVMVGVHVIYPSQPALLDAVEAVFIWEEECLYRHGNEGYGVLKQVEPLVKAYLIHIADPLLGGRPDDVLHRMREVVVGKERDLGTSHDFLTDHLLDILRRVPEITHLVELFGLQRMTGHPLIDPRVGGASAAEEASKPSSTSYANARRLRNNWCRMYLEGFVVRSGEWPRLSFSPEGRTTQLYQLYKIRDRDIRRESYPLSDWEHVRFLPHQDFDYYTNFTDLMDDKSISFYRDEFRTTWDKRVKPRSHKRLLIEMLHREEISIRNIIMQIEAGNIPESWFIVSLYPKEREFKLAARMFSMMVFEMRVFFTALEANIADHVFPNLPQQTMTLSKVEILERFFHLSKPITVEGRTRLYIEVDLTRWNLRWRDMPIRMIGMDLDDIFGTNGRYTLVHSFFKRCMILVRVAGYPPEGLEQDPPPQSDLLWYNHEGGFEGITQKHWTVATYAMVDLGMANYDVEYSLVGQGDNQVILASLNVPAEREVKSYLVEVSEGIKRDIAASCAKVGQETREEECLESTNVVTYSKDFFVNGSEYFLSLKAVSRIFPRGASDFPTISNGLASISSSSIAAAERLKHPTIGYFLGLFHSARFLIRVRTRTTVEGLFMTRKTKEKLDETTIRAILCLPNSLGGMSVPSLLSYLYKGGGDPCSKDYASMKILYAGGYHALGHINTALTSGSWAPRSIDPAQLLEDPYAIPLRRVATAENKVLSTSLSHMKSHTYNRDLRDLLETSVLDYDTALKESLLSVRPFNPLLLADLRSASVVGARDMVSRMFTVTRTIQSLTHRSEADPGASILSASASEMQAVLEKLLKLPATRTAFGPVYQTMEHMRGRWRTKERNVVPEGVTSYNPLDWKILVDNEVYDEEGVFLAYSPTDDPWHTRGPEEPYLGEETREKRTQHGYRIITSSAAEKAYERLAKIATQPGVDDSFKALVCQIARTRSAIPLEALLPFLSQAVGGSIAHRYQAVMGDRGASPLGCGTIASHIYINSNYSGLLSASLVDYPVMFQEVFVAGIALLNLLARRDPKRTWYLRFKTPDDLVPLPEDSVVAVSAPSNAPVLASNPIAYCHDLSLLRVTRPLDAVLITPTTTSDMSDISPARIAYQAAYRQLLNRHTAHLIADRGYSAVRLPLDLLEYRGLGLASVIKGVTTAIARFTVDAMFSRSSLDLRWNPLPVIEGLAESFSAHLQRAARHPLFQDDPVAIEYFSRTYAKYNERKERKTVIGLLVTRVLENLDKLSSLHLDLTELVFDDDSEETPLLRAESIMKRIVLRAVIRGELTAEDGYKIARRNLVQAVRMAESVGGKIHGIYLLACSTSEWAASGGLTGLAEETSALAEGRLIKRVFQSQVQLLRALRGRVFSHRVHRQVLAGNTTTNLQTPLIKEKHPVNSMPPLILPEDRGSADFLAFQVKRRHVRVYGRHAPAVYSYWPVGPYMRGQNVVILGAGNGGATAVARAFDAVTIVAHDRRSDIATEGLLAKAPKYYRSTAGYSTAGGDLMVETTWEGLKQHLTGYRVIIVDIPASWDEYQAIFSRLSTRAKGCLIVTRWILRTSRIGALIATASSVAGYLGLVHIFTSNTFSEILIITRVEWSGAWTPLVGTLPTDQIDMSLPDYTGIRITGGGVPWNNMTYRGFSDSVRDRARAMAHQAIGKDRHTFTHNQWTEVLFFLVSVEVDNAADWVREVVDIALRRDVTTVNVGSAQIPVFVTTALRRWLLVDYPRTRPV